MKEIDRSGELLALCYREQWPKATQLLDDETLTASTVASAIHQAVVDSREEVLLFLLATARRELLTLNTSVQKDGKTLLQLALESNNLRFVHALLTAGADVTVADKKGVRPMDLMAWTAMVHPTAMVPLQDSVLHLQQRNELQRERISALNETTTSLQSDEQNLLACAHEIEEDVAAARSFRTEVDEQIRRAQATDRELAISVQAEEVKLEWIRGEVGRLHTQNGTADLEVARINEETERLAAASAALRMKHKLQEQGRGNVAAQRAIKCEVIGILRQFPGNEALQTRALRALLVMCKKPTIRRQLLIYGLQNALIEVLQQLPRQASVHLGVCQLILLLSSTVNDFEGMQRWRTKELVDSLLAACTTVKADSPTISDEVYRVTLNVFTCLKTTPQLHDVAIKELHELLDTTTHRLREAQLNMSDGNRLN
ncbi:minichromosome maintenance- protein [Phytophthora pseudosyringae]|uniref:Minichromosome maintenance- protein n=1 Tax=Phytophthora pseudosyringae TaxID=221518 RepID=A0A8T1V4L4_9STRA|nr:minichromosome maintenance- protein [Phytophthora pseudosyringae]